MFIDRLLRVKGFDEKAKISSHLRKLALMVSASIVVTCLWYLFQLVYPVDQRLKLKKS